MMEEHVTVIAKNCNHCYKHCDYQINQEALQFAVHSALINNPVLTGITDTTNLTIQVEIKCENS